MHKPFCKQIQAERVISPEALASSQRFFDLIKDDSSAANKQHCVQLLEIPGVNNAVSKVGFEWLVIELEKEIALGNNAGIGFTSTYSMLLLCLNFNSKAADVLRIKTFVDTPRAFLVFLRYCESKWTLTKNSNSRTDAREVCRGVFRELSFLLCIPAVAKVALRTMDADIDANNFEMVKIITRMMHLPDNASDIEGLVWQAVALIKLQAGNAKISSRLYDLIYAQGQMAPMIMLFNMAAVPAAQKMIDQGGVNHAYSSVGR